MTEARPKRDPLRDKLHYTMMAVGKFAVRHGLTRKDSALYLVRYKGIEFLDEFYDVVHTLSFDDCVDDLTTICKNNGGDIL